MSSPVQSLGRRRVVLGDLVENVDDFYDRESQEVERYVAGEHIDEGTLAVRRWGLTTDGLFPPTFNRRFRSGDVLFHSRNPRKLARPAFDGITGEKLFVLRVRRPEVLLPGLLPFLLQTTTFTEYVNRMRAGSTNKFLNKRPLMRYEFDLPPLDEQRRIAEALQAADSLQSLLEGALDKARTVQRSTLGRLFPMKHEAAKARPLSELAVLVSDGTHQPPAFEENGIPFLLVGNLKGGKIDWNTDKYVSQETYEQLSRSWRPQSGDVLYTLVGSYGMPALVEDDRPFAFQRHTGIVRVRQGELGARFLWWYLRSPAGVAQSHLSAEGLAQKTITLGALRNLAIPAPSLEEQESVVGVLDEQEAAIDLLAHRREAARRLVKSIAEVSLEEVDL